MKAVIDFFRIAGMAGIITAVLLTILMGMTAMMLLGIDTGPYGTGTFIGSDTPDDGTNALQ